MSTETTQPEKQIVTIREAAQMLGFSLRTVKKMIKHNRLPVSRIGRTVRINRADVLALVPPGGRTTSTEPKKDPST